MRGAASSRGAWWGPHSTHHRGEPTEIMKRLFTLAALCLALSGATISSAHAAPEIVASDRAAQVLECATPAGPYGISSACAQKISLESARDALRFANATASSGAAP